MDKEANRSYYNNEVASGQDLNTSKLKTSKV